jgi:hypothetical protein
MLEQADMFQESAAFGTALCIRGAPEGIHFVGLKSVSESVKKAAGPLREQGGRLLGPVSGLLG